MIFSLSHLSLLSEPFFFKGMLCFSRKKFLISIVTFSRKKELILSQEIMIGFSKIPAQAPTGRTGPFLLRSTDWKESHSEKVVEYLVLPPKVTETSYNLALTSLLRSVSSVTYRSHVSLWAAARILKKLDMAVTIKLPERCWKREGEVS